jgi:hypothetical protein
MAGQAGTLEQMALELAGILGQVGTRMRSSNDLKRLRYARVLVDDLSERGEHACPGEASVLEKDGEPTSLAAIDADDTVQIAARVATVLAKTTQTLASFADVANQLQAVGPTLPGVTAQQVNDLVAGFPRKLLDLFIAESLDIIPAVGGTLTLLGVVDKVEIAGDPANPTKPTFDKTEVQLGRLLDLASKPGQYFTTRFGWGSPGFDGTGLLQAIDRLFERLDLPSTYFPPSGGDPAKLDAFAFDITVDTTVFHPVFASMSSFRSAETSTFRFRVRLRPGCSTRS